MRLHIIYKILVSIFISILFFNKTVDAQVKDANTSHKKSSPSVKRTLYGIASFYSDHFHGRETSNGETFSQKKMTCACNVVPLGTWLRVTNLKNGRSIIVRVNDHIAPHMKRIVDLSRAGAEKLNFVKAGLTRVKVEVLGKKKPEE